MECTTSHSLDQQGQGSLQQWNKREIENEGMRHSTADAGTNVAKKDKLQRNFPAYFICLQTLPSAVAEWCLREWDTSAGWSKPEDPSRGNEHEQTEDAWFLVEGIVPACILFFLVRRPVSTNFEYWILWSMALARQHTSSIIESGCFNSSLTSLGLSPLGNRENMLLKNMTRSFLFWQDWNVSFNQYLTSSLWWLMCLMKNSFTIITAIWNSRACQFSFWTKLLLSRKLTAGFCPSVWVLQSIFLNHVRKAWNHALEAKM